jgi:hypothetical protein
MRDNDNQMPVLIVRQWPAEASRTPNSPCAWIAEAEAGGVLYIARSRHGAPNALFRQLVAAGIPDGPAEVHTSDLRGAMRYGSFHAAATVTYTEGATRSVAMVRYREYPGAGAVSSPSSAECPKTAHGAGVDGGEPTPDGSLEPELRVTSKSEPGDRRAERQQCAVCGRLFRPWRPQAAHCSRACRQKAYRLRATRSIPSDTGEEAVR